MSRKIVFILANSADSDEIPPNVAFHLGLDCLPNYLFTGIQNEKGIAWNVLITYFFCWYVFIHEPKILLYFFQVWYLKICPRHRQYEMWNIDQNSGEKRERKKKVIVDSNALAFVMRHLIG